VDDTGLSQISDELPMPELSALPTTQDIPAAVRESTGTPTRIPTASKRTPLWIGIGGLGVAALITIPLVLALRSSPSAPEATTPEAVADSASGSAAAQTSPSLTDAEPTEKALLGHLLYEEAPKTELAPITRDGGIMLRKAAAEKFDQMVDAAAAEGIPLVPLSGFRSVAEQESVFFDVKAERGEVATKRAVVSAPPGYSEHHTGYAIDIGDGNHPGADLQFDFEDTAAFKWLKENAAYYSFELSFPKNNSLGVSYEPWHWRFVGDRHSLETFYRARTPQEQQAVGDPASSETIPSDQESGSDQTR
jgi:D-alanyl-D-alanine carboxypeptidase